ncbi:hypothetical protein BDY17DRAFT_297134 [Neohortaea acidophila]|uniref:adenosine deaminase n=1 Tax=Neohortaea acidophila TaxID=245834 RepID=A0A6A6PTG0_9PEZI|nr:uncharacterized protein BDY17DRAFT_297134 [Neohortaea acidophila]KAF2483272.1 hypothetical protein BDY17DRAFT_297134 [Neohortaea acidophila]
MDWKRKMIQEKRKGDDLDEDTWAAQEGVPSFDEPFIQKYLDGRDALIVQENRLRSDHAFRESLSPMAREACAIVADIRAQERKTLWNRNFEDNLAELAEGNEASIHPGMMFGMAKDRMESSKLWRIVRKMPKGALLHCHMSATGALDTLIDDALRTDGMCIWSTAPLSSPLALQTNQFMFRHCSTVQSGGTVSIWSDSYTPEALVSLQDAADSFPENGRDGFKAWVMSRVTITTERSIRHHDGLDDIWTRFRTCFPIADSLVRYEPLFRKYVWRILTQLNEDGVRWVDIRSDFVMPFYSAGANEPDDGFDNYMKILQETIETFKQSEEGKGFWGARIIWTSIRSFDTRTIVEDMMECIRLKIEFPDLICGYDFVGQEDQGRPLAELTPEIFWFRKRCREEGVELPFYFHAGETLGTGSETDENLFDAILLGTRRIGHGFSLYKHPLLIDMVKEKKILIESCPISNEVLRLTASILSHPLPALLARGVSCCLANDDPAMLGHATSGMSHDFWQALQGWENLGLDGLASLAENSVRYASFGDCNQKQWTQEVRDGAFGTGLRAQCMKQWAAEFEKFCQWVVLEYGAEYGGEMEE